MNTLAFFQEVLSTTIHKVDANVAEYTRIAGQSTRVKATTLYDIYRHMVFETDERLPMKDFFRVCAQYLYYDKYVCEHGTEFYYYVAFNDTHPMMALTKPVIDAKIDAHRPERLTDLRYIVKAFEKKEIV